MRKGSAAIVPLFLAIMILFWFMMFLGGASDTQKVVNDVGNLSHLHDRLIYSVTKHYYSLKAANPSWSDEKLETEANKYVRIIMKKNKIDD
ncbi:hypothetical protein JHD47_09165 [Sulfurimonas sp. SAG-AH-194-L11]|nr:hypothetical protein [Sulfurimonas sp. SAG-AH-194-L11]MDF1877983.1 hypothetical protein [Sulfurimonas sp. SAG-AH-194-L11]